jgi:hypothetical protein
MAGKAVKEKIASPMNFNMKNSFAGNLPIADSHDKRNCATGWQKLVSCVRVWVRISAE